MDIAGQHAQKSAGGVGPWSPGVACRALRSAPPEGEREMGTFGHWERPPSQKSAGTKSSSPESKRIVCARGKGYKSGPGQEEHWQTNGFYLGLRVPYLSTPAAPACFPKKGPRYFRAVLRPQLGAQKSLAVQHSPKSEHGTNTKGQTHANCP